MGMAERTKMNSSSTCWLSRELKAQKLKASLFIIHDLLLCVSSHRSQLMKLFPFGCGVVSVHTITVSSQSHSQSQWQIAIEFAFQQSVWHTHVPFIHSMLLHTQSKVKLYRNLCVQMCAALCGSLSIATDMRMHQFKVYCWINDNITRYLIIDHLSCLRIDHCAFHCAKLRVCVMF